MDQNSPSYQLASYLALKIRKIGGVLNSQISYWSSVAKVQFLSLKTEIKITKCIKEIPNVTFYNFKSIKYVCY